MLREEGYRVQYEFQVSSNPSVHLHPYSTQPSTTSSRVSGKTQISSPPAPCRGLRSGSHWVYHNYIRNFKDGADTPRLFCPQAVVRASWNLFNAVHTSQADKDLLIPSEATLPSITMWHGLKISFPPQPWFIDPPQDAAYMDELLNGGPPYSSHSGCAWGATESNDTAFEHFYAMHPTWRWATDFPEKVVKA